MYLVDPRISSDPHPFPSCYTSNLKEKGGKALSIVG